MGASGLSKSQVSRLSRRGTMRHDRLRVTRTTTTTTTTKPANNYCRPPVRTENGTIPPISSPVPEYAIQLSS